MSQKRQVVSPNERKKNQSYLLIEALNAGGIKALLESPAHFLALRRRLHEESEKPPAESLRMGSAVDHLILDDGSEDRIKIYEPSIKLKKDGTPYAVQPKSFNNEEGHAFINANREYICLTPEEFEEAEALAEKIRLHPNVQEYIKGGQAKVRIHTTMATRSGFMIPVKAEIDYLTDTHIIDLKTSSELSSRFGYTARKWGYDIQAAWYQMLCELYDGKFRQVIFLNAEKFDPYEVGICKASQLTIESARARCEAAMDIYAQCLDSGNWPGYSNNVEEF